MERPTDAREIGVIKSTTSRGFGFIRRVKDANGNKRPDLYVHASECNNEFDSFKPGDKVEFSLGKDNAGREEAKNVVACAK